MTQRHYTLRAGSPQEKYVSSSFKINWKKKGWGEMEQGGGVNEQESANGKVFI